MIPNFLSQDELDSYVEINQDSSIPPLNDKPFVGQEVIYAFARHTKNGHAVTFSNMVVVKASAVNAMVLKVTLACCQTENLYVVIRDVEVVPLTIIDSDNGGKFQVILVDVESRPLVIKHLAKENDATTLERIDRILGGGEDHAAQG